MDRYRSAPLQTRHRLVFEIGDAGVEKLGQSAFAPAEGEAAAWAAVYLERAGMHRGEHGARLDLGPAPAPELPLLEDAQALFTGAFAAVEAIKATLGLGQPGRVEDALRVAPFEREREE